MFEYRRRSYHGAVEPPSPVQPLPAAGSFGYPAPIEDHTPGELARYMMGGWGCVSLAEWLCYLDEETQTVQQSIVIAGWLRPAYKADFPHLDLTRHDKWALLVYREPTDPKEDFFYLIPGCRVAGVQKLLRKPDRIGFLAFEKVESSEGTTEGES